MWYNIDWESAGQVILTGVFSGIGSALGSYLALNYGIHKLKKLLNRRVPEWRLLSLKQKTKK